MARLSPPTSGMLAVRTGLLNAIATMRKTPPASPAPAAFRITPAQALLEVRELLASDAYAATFLSLGNYRTAMLATADSYIRECDDVPK